MLFSRSVGRRSRKVEERNPLEDEAFPPGRGDRAPLRGLDPEAFEHLLVHGPRVRARVQREAEPLEEDGWVVRSLGDQDELLGRIGYPDLREGAWKLVIAGDVERELGPPVPKAGLAPRAGSAEMGPGREEVTLSRYGTRVEEGDERRRLLGQFSEGSDDGLRRGTTGAGAAGAGGADRALLGRRKRGHRGGSLPHELEELVERPGLERVVLLALAGDRGRRGRAVVMARQHDEGVV